MKVNLKKIGAIVAGATILASSVAFAGLGFGNTQLVNENGQPVVKIVVGEKAAASDGVAAASIAAKIASEAFKTSTLTAQVVGLDKVTCSLGSGAANATGSCTVSDQKAKLEITVPGGITPGAYTFKSLIGDPTDRTIEDRGQGTLSNYTLTTAETSDEAHPFTKGDAAASSLAQSEEGLFRVTGSMFDDFKDYTAQDKESGKTYKEQQSVLARIESQYRDTDDQVDSKIRNWVYQVKFTHDNYGIPECTTSLNASWAHCDDTSTVATSNHKVKVKFLGEEWVITKISPPSTTIANETTILDGGEVNLAKESVGGIVNVGDTLTAGAFKVRLDDIKSGSTSAEQGAIVSLLDASGAVVKQTTIAPGSTSTLTTTATGEKVLLRVFKTAPGYTFGAKWADMSIISNELVLKNNDVPEVNGDRDKNTNWKARLMWKNRDLGNDNNTDHLRAIALYRDTATDYLKKGDKMNFMELPIPYTVTYTGLNLADADRDKLSITHSDGSFTYTPDGSTTSRETARNNVVWLRIRSDVSGAFSTSVGTGNELIVLFGTGVNRTANLSSGDSGFAQTMLEPGQILLKLSNGKYVNVANTSYGLAQNISYTTGGPAATVTGGGVVSLGFGSSNATAGGLLVAGEGTNQTSGFDIFGTGQTNFSTFTAGVPGGNARGSSADDFAIVVVEDAGESLAAQKPAASAFHYNISGKTLNVAAGSYVADKVRYASVANFSKISDAWAGDGYKTTSMPANKEINFVTERGSIVSDITTSTITMKVAKKPARLQLDLVKSGTAVTTASTTLQTLGVGDSYEVPGTAVKLKLVGIDQKVGACSVGTGAAPACTSDTKGLSAVIMPDNKASVIAGVPFGYDKFGPLVVLDRDAIGTEVLVTVGGPAVNAVTKDVLAGSVVDFAVEKKVVKEVVAGKKIIVAGMTASDTLEAAKDFISALKRQ